MAPFRILSRCFTSPCLLAIVAQWVAVQLAPAQSTPDRVSLIADQTPIRDQAGRGACWAFGGAAALEAAYKRKYHLNLHLSEEYIFHVGKVMELYPNYMQLPAGQHEDNNSLTDAQGCDDVVFKMALCAIPEARFAPYWPNKKLLEKLPGAPALNSGTQSSYDAFNLSSKLIPTSALAHCQYRVTPGGWRRLENSHSPAEIEAALASGHEVVVAFAMNWKLVNPAKAIYDFNGKSDAPSHIMLLVGYDRPARLFRVKNSWGPKWGDHGYANLTYNFVEHCSNGASYITDVVDPRTPPQKQAFWLGQWNMDHDGWKGQLTLRRFTDFRANSDTFYGPTKLGNYTRDGQSYDVNGTISADGQHCTFYIASSADRVPPGATVGQKFEMYCFGNDINHAAGYTTWEDKPFGAIMSRVPVPTEQGGSPPLPSEWTGSYAINIDGLRGELKLASVDPVSGTYTEASGRSCTISGSLGTHGNDLNLSFDGAGQPLNFALYHHTREHGVFAGTGTVQGHTVGVMGFKKGA